MVVWRCISAVSTIACLPQVSVSKGGCILRQRDIHLLGGGYEICSEHTAGEYFCHNWRLKVAELVIVGLTLRSSLVLVDWDGRSSRLRRQGTTHNYYLASDEYMSNRNRIALPTYQPISLLAYLPTYQPAS